MRSALTPAACVLFLFSLSAAQADGPDDYLTKDGKLKERLEVRELQGGFAGFTGTYRAIETDGSWSTGPFGPRNEKKPAKASGKLTAEQLTGLAKELAKHELKSLANHGEATVNPKLVVIDFGKKSTTLQPNAAKGAAADDKAMRARYQGIASAVQGLCKEAGEK